MSEARAELDEELWLSPAPGARARAVEHARLLHLVSGQAQVDLLGTRLVVRQGETLLSGPGCNPVVEHDGASVALTLAFPVPAPCSSQPRFALLRLADARVLRAFRAARDAGPANPVELRALVSAVGQAVLEAAAAVRPEVARAGEVLRARYAERVSLEALSRETSLSKFHLVRLFRKQVGLPPHAYQLWVRTLKAREMLAGGLDIVDVAIRCGFADQAHLTRCFRRFLGATPSDARAGARPRALG